MKKVILLILVLLILTVQNTSAKEIFYQNDNGVILTKEEYDFFTEMYWNGYQKNLTIEDYNYIKELDLFDKVVEKKTIELFDFPIERSSSVTSNLMILTISKSCSNTCTLSLVTRWIGTPNVKSYDVFGARADGVNITNIRNARVEGDNYYKIYSNPQKNNNGFGFSILVPNESNVIATITFTTTKGGTVYGSYQHAMRNTTENISKQYSINENGFGRVFDFTGTARNIYDNAPGVDIAV